ncbi:putative capsid protein [Avon-Heathcote Estuary associated circular virus 19]|uniref:putative capsid protein n=1 Tax=Avon-Heathcote Estuary associated circular virus 19 TaxID=1618242 RepID=UPI0005CCFEA7|nr:putative capsid protein [Avon-Heathcote Estuary associated circular virus 19]AJP36445.1 putative capsid protein [Avon-Heathcote Estuary associated circular virus 19]
MARSRRRYKKSSRSRWSFPALHYPGYNYLGPGTKNFDRAPRNDLDAAARKHDLDYGKLQRGGRNPYFKWFKADQRFLDRIAKDKSVPGWIARQTFRAKKYFAPQGDELPRKHTGKRSRSAIPVYLIDRFSHKKQKTLGGSLKKMRRTWRRPRALKRRRSASYGRKRRYKRRRYPSMKPLYRKIKRVAKGLGRMQHQNAVANVYRDVSSGNVSWDAGECAYKDITAILTSGQMDNVLSTFRVLQMDAGVNSRETLDLDTGTATANVKFVNARSRTVFRNNTTQRANIAVYVLTPTQDLSNTPSSLVSSGLTTAEATAPSIDIKYWPVDSPIFRRYWKIVKKRTRALDPGDEMTVMMRRNKPFSWNNKPNDVNAESYRGMKSQVVMVR